MSTSSEQSAPVDTTTLNVVALYLATKGQTVGADLVRRAIDELHAHRLREAVIEASVTDWWNGRPASSVVEEVWTAVVLGRTTDA